jgi:hypothetical protein
MILKKGTVNSAVELLQKLLTERGFDTKGVDGWFGNDTEVAVMAFQRAHGIKDDGIVGDDTWRALGENPTPQPQPDEAKMHWEKVPANVFKDGYDNFRLREDVARSYLSVYNAVKEAGGIIPSSGGKRELSAYVGQGRSATSFHYTGRALDVMIGSAMANPTRDPLVVAQDSTDRNPYWRIFVKADGGEQMTLDGMTWRRGAPLTKRVSGRFIDLTELFKQAGFDRIRARNNWREKYINTEWWHFQYETGLIAGESTFGDELLKVYDRDFVARYRPWEYRHYIFSGQSFRRP